MRWVSIHHIPHLRALVLIRASSQAEEYLVTNRWDLSSAAAEYYTSQEEGVDEVAEEADEPAPPTGPRTLGGAPAPPSAIPTVSSSQPSAPSGQASGSAAKKKFATLKDLGNDPGHAHSVGGHGHDDDDDDEDEPRDLFAGGEKSALAVQNPGDPRNQVKDILNKAKK